MKATGEIMGIGSTLTECFLKSVRSLEVGADHFYLKKFDVMATDELFDYIKEYRHDGIFAITELLRRGETDEKLKKLSYISMLFLETLLEL